MKARLILLLLCLGMFCFLQSSFIGYAQNGENIPQEPQKITPSSKQMQTLEEKLDLILEQYSELKATDKELEQEVKEAFRDNTSYISLGMTTLGVFAGTLALIGIFITAMTYFNSNKYLDEMKEEQKKVLGCSEEIKSLLDTTKKDVSNFREDFLQQPIDDKIDDKIAVEANEQINDISNQGKNILLAIAVQASKNEEWEKAYSFWKALSEIDKNNNSLFYYARACLYLFEKLNNGISHEFLLLEAEEIFQVMTDADKDESILVLWGLILSRHAGIKQNLIQQSYLWVSAEDKYRMAVKLNANNSSAWFNWGVLLFNKSKIANDIEEKKHLSCEALKKYTEAIRINLTDAYAWYSSGVLLSEQVKITEDVEEKSKLISESKLKYAEAARLSPDMFDVWFNWGNLLTSEFEETNDFTLRENLKAEAELKYAKATSIEANHSNAWCNWGYILARQANFIDNVIEQNVLRDKAQQKFSKAIEANPTNGEAWFMWGVMLLEQASASKALTESKHFLDMASKKYKEALRINPEHSQALCNLGVILLQQARFANSEFERNTFLSEAYDNFLKTVSLDPKDSIAYLNLACIEALRGNSGATVHYLANCKILGRTDLMEVVLQEKEFDSVRNSFEMQNFLKTLTI